MAVQAKRHGRRAIRSSLTGPALPNPDARAMRFELDARGALEALRMLLPDEMSRIKVGFSTAPVGVSAPPGRNSARRLARPAQQPQSEQPLLYSIDRKSESITLHRMPIQRARGLHVDDAEHRRLFVGHCLYRAVCEYLGREPWDLLPGYFYHY